MESRTERADDYAGFSAWLRGTMRRNGYEVDGPRPGGQQRLAADTGLSPAAISKYMTGKSLPGVQEMVKLAGPLGTTVRELLLRTGRVLEEDLVADTGNPLIDPMLDTIYGMDYLPMATRKARAEDFLRRVEDARRLTEHELEDDMRRHQEEHGDSIPNST
jgi:transcriptional regulator with XRE-family HTH domain